MLGPESVTSVAFPPPAQVVPSLVTKSGEAGEGGPEHRTVDVELCGAFSCPSALRFRVVRQAKWTEDMHTAFRLLLHLPEDSASSNAQEDA